MKTRLSFTLLLVSTILVQAAKESPTATPAKEKSGAATHAFQWVEEPRTPAAAAWITHQAIEAHSKNRPEIAKGLIEMLGAENLTAPCAQDGIYFFTKSEGKKKKSSIYLRKGLQGSDELLIDATKVAGGRDSSLTIFDSSADASLLVYGVRDGKGEEQVVRVFDVKARVDLPDKLLRARYNTVSLSPGNKGVYYTKIEPTGTRVFFHPLGAETAADKLIFGDTYNYEPLGPNDLISTEVTENGRYLLFCVARGQPARRDDVYSQELDKPDRRVRPIIHTGRDNRFSVVNHEEQILALTDNEAPRKRVVKFLIDDPSPLNWKTIVPEGEDVISDFSIVGDKLFVSGPQGKATQTRIFTLDGTETGQITHPPIDSATSVHHQCSSR